MRRCWITTLGMALVAGGVMAVEEASYTMIHKERTFELRDYAPQIVAETLVSGNREDAGNKAFRKLFRYISGENTASKKIAMTAPVGQEPSSESIPMTRPVVQGKVEQRWAVSFMMPAEYTLETLPSPNDASVKLRLIPARRVAARRYSGRWTQSRYQKFHAELVDWMGKRRLTAAGPAEWARYNAPFTLPLFRRNEILIPVADDALPVQ